MLDQLRFNSATEASWARALSTEQNYLYVSLSTLKLERSTLTSGLFSQEMQTDKELFFKTTNHHQTKNLPSLTSVCCNKYITEIIFKEMPKL